MLEGATSFRSTRAPAEPRGAPGAAPPPARAAAEARVLGLGVAVGLCCAAAFVAAGSLRLVTRSDRVPVASLTAFFLLACWPLLARVGRWVGSPRAQAVAAVGASAIAPLLWMGAAYAASDPLVASHWRCGTGDVGFVILFPAALGIFGALGTLLAVATVGRERRLLDGALHLLGLLAAAALGALVTASLVAASRRPDVDTWVGSLPVVLEAPVVGAVPASGYDVAANHGNEALHVTVFEDAVTPDASLVRRCAGNGYCECVVAPLGAPRPTARPGSGAGLGVAEGQRVLVRADAARDLWILEQGASRMAFRGADGAPVDIGVRDVAGAASPPRGWIAGGAFGLLAFGVLWLSRRRAGRRLVELGAAASGATARGWIALDGGGPPFRAPPELALDDGPVTVIAPSPARRVEVYRADAPLTAACILAGRKEDLLAVERARAATLDAWGLAAVLLTAPPLVVALGLGLLQA